MVIVAVIAPLSAWARDYSVTFRDKTPEEVVAILEKETGLSVIAQKSLIGNRSKKMTGDFSAPTIEGLLDKVVRGKLGLDYKIVDGSIVLKEPQDVKEPESTIRGKVIDSDGEPLVGATVYNKSNRSQGAVTNIDGEFTMKANGKKSCPLLVSYFGMKKQEVDWKGKPLIITMHLDESTLDEVVVTGYQVIDKRASTSAITSIKAEDVLRPDAISIDQMLEGHIPDMMYMSNSGEAGVAPKIRIRGTSSIIGNREPLWVVDGIVVQDPVPISADELNDPDYINRIGNAIAGLNPQDIERLDVLKDASATAIYGTRAANGVIVVTTKRGKEGAPRIRYNNTFTWKARPRYTDGSVDVMNSWERTRLSRELAEKHYVYDKNNSLIGYDMLLSQYYNGEITKQQFDEQIPFYETVNTDWFKLLTHDSFSQSHTLTVSGGGSRASYYASLGITDNDDVVKGTKNKRYNAMLNLDINFSSWLTAQFSLKGNVSDREYYQDELAPVQYAYRTSRALPAYNPDGTLYSYRKVMVNRGFNYGYNILNELNNSGIEQNGSTIGFDANFRFRFTDWLTANAIFDYTASNTTIEGYWGAQTGYAANLRGCEYGETADEYSTLPQGGELSHNDTRQRAWTARLQLDWNNYFGEAHNFSGGIGFEASSTTYKGYSAITRGYFPDRGKSVVSDIDIEQFPSYGRWLAGNVPTITDSKSNIVSAYLTVSYNWDRMIFLNANARVDGSNAFGDRSNDKLLPIWSVSGSFDAGRLAFFRDRTWLDYFSIKASYGYQGNMLSSESPVMIIKKNPYNSFYGEYTSSVQKIPNPDLKWEKTSSYNIGLDAGFFDRKLMIEGNLYWKKTKDAFMNKTISTINGYESYVINGGDIDNYGYSAAITYRPISNQDWTWSISTNFSRTINKVKSTPSSEQYELDDFLNGTAIVKDKAVGTFYSYKFLGLSPVDGGPMFDDWTDHTEDLKGLSKYETYTQVLRATGNREPYMSGSLSSTLRWKNLRMNTNFVYSLGAKTRLFGMYGAGTASSGVYAEDGEIKSENNLSRDYLDRWRKPGDEKFTTIPAIFSSIESASMDYNDHWSTHLDGVQEIAQNYWDMYDYSDLRVVSGDYLKLSSLSFTYEFPMNWLKPWGCHRLELSVTGTNLFTICDKKLKGQTPTQGGFSTIQLSDRPGFSFGLSATF